MSHTQEELDYIDESNYPEDELIDLEELEKKNIPNLLIRRMMQRGISERRAKQYIKRYNAMKRKK